MAPPLAELRSLSYWYPDSSTAALRDIDWKVEPGLQLLRGNSGSGKSSLLRTLNGLIPHFHGGRIRGEIQVGGNNGITARTSRLAETVGLVFQDPETQAIGATVAADVAFGIRMNGSGHESLIHCVDSALAQVGLDGFAQRRVNTLSGGERQRLAIAGVLAMKPQILAMDEPLSQLDDESAADVVRICNELQTQGLAIVLSEHRLELFHPATRTLQLDAGSVVEMSGNAGFSVESEPPQLQPVTGGNAWEVSEIAVSLGDVNLVCGASLYGRRGEVVAITGNNGSGKTTLLRAIAGVLKPQTGSVWRLPRLAYLPQNPGALLHRETVRAEIATALAKSGSKESAETWMQRFGLQHLALRFPRDLSSGQRQRCALAVVLASEPDIVLLDEPTRGMDPASRSQLVSSLADVCARGTSAVVATHDRSLVSHLAHRCYEVSAGSVRERVVAGSRWAR